MPVNLPPWSRGAVRRKNFTAASVFMESDLTHPPEGSKARPFAGERQWPQGVRCLSPAEHLKRWPVVADSLLGTVKPPMTRTHLTSFSAFWSFFAFWTSQNREISRRSWGGDIKVTATSFAKLRELENSHLFIEERGF